ncbi:MAG: GNAT family N-acetyltransferase [Polyangiaceae bacterium]|jgi:RimJ/RimL family protein N-acetyltransferase
MATLVIRTARQILREQGPCDANDIFVLNADDEVTRYTGGDSFESVEQARRFLESYQHVHRREGMARWTALDSRTGEFLGWCGLRRQSDGDVDLGYRYRQSLWGRGLATEAGQACLRIAFERLRLSSVIARAHPENVASLRVMQKLGFQFEASSSCEGLPALVYRLRADAYRP